MLNNLEQSDENTYNHIDPASLLIERIIKKRKHSAEIIADYLKRKIVFPMYFNSRVHKHN